MPYPTLRLLMTALVALVLTGCGSSPSRPVSSGRSPATEAELRTQVEDLETQVRILRADLAGAREEASSQELKRIDAETRLDSLQRRFDELERSHDDAVSEVVRAQAKLRGSVGQADAASNIAEAEIALNQSVDLAEGEADQIRELLADAATEFDGGNYGGALYLSNQAKRIISLARSRSSAATAFEPVEDEIPFETPLALVVSDTSNVRDGPSLNNSILTTLSEGTPVDGYSYKGAWVRIRMDDGSSGWIYQTLVTSRTDNGEAARDPIE